MAGEPVAGSCAGAAAGATAGTIDAGRTCAGAVGTGRIDAFGVDDVEPATVELDEGGTLDELGGTLLDDELGGTLLDDELGGTLDEELGGTLDEELGGTLDEELGGTDDDELGGTDDELLDDELELTIDVLDVSVVAPAGPLRTAMSPSTSPAPSADHPALALPSMTSLPDCPAWLRAGR